MLRRIIPVVSILALLSAGTPAPVDAMSTAAEIQLGQEEDQQIVQSNVIENDPLLNAYVQGIANNLWNQVARRDIPYSIKIIKGTDVNSFATMGGFVYVYEGLVDFVQSDDELASVIGHETGHIERRHVITSQSKAEALNILFGIASLFSPLIYDFGNIAEAGVMAKIERSDELQADRYGLQLMARAGYDPDAMVTMMQHLGDLEDDHSDLVTKYLQDHPNPKDRVAHLQGYPELDPKLVTPDQLLVQATSDEERSRYEFSAIKLQSILEKEPNNAQALLDLGQDDLALGLTSKSEQTLSTAEQLGTPQTRAVAGQEIAALRQMEARRVTLTQPSLSHLESLIASAKASQIQASTDISARVTEGKDQLKAVNARLQNIQYEIPDMSRVNAKHGSRLEAIEKNLNLMSRSINSALEDAATPIGGVGTLEPGKQSGLLKDGSEIFDELSAPFVSLPIPPDTLAILPSYPAMVDEMQLGDTDMVRSVDAARASLTMLDQSLGDLDELFKDLDHGQTYSPTIQVGYNGDMNTSEYNSIQPLMQKCVDEFNGAATAASQGAQLYNIARSRQLSVRITLLGVGTSAQRYATLETALQQRFGMSGVDFHTMLRNNLTPGDVTAATIIAADTKTTPAAVIAEAQSNKTSIIDVANAHGMHAWPLEIFMGLVYLDYTDNPEKETRKAGGNAGVTL